MGEPFDEAGRNRAIKALEVDSDDGPMSRLGQTGRGNRGVTRVGQSEPEATGGRGAQGSQRHFEGGPGVPTAALLRRDWANEPLAQAHGTVESGARRFPPL